MLPRSVLYPSLLVNGAICSSRKMAKFCVFCIRLLCHPVPNDAARKIKRIEIIDRKVPGQKDMFAPVLLGVPGQMTRCPCGFGAYGKDIWPLKYWVVGCWHGICLGRSANLHMPFLPPKQQQRQSTEGTLLPYDGALEIVLVLLLSFIIICTPWQCLLSAVAMLQSVVKVKWTMLLWMSLTLLWRLMTWVITWNSSARDYAEISNTFSSSALLTAR